MVDKGWFNYPARRMQSVTVACMLLIVQSNSALGIRIGGTVPVRCMVELGEPLYSEVAGQPRLRLWIRETCNAPFALDLLHSTLLPGLRFAYDGRSIDASPSGKTRLSHRRPPSMQRQELVVTAHVPLNELKQFATLIYVIARPDEW